MVTQQDLSWVLLSYRMPREPSTPRIAVWRRLRQLGVAQVGDGLVALPAQPETIEQLEWVAERVTESDGDAVVWTATPTRRQDSMELVHRLNQARSEEYSALVAEVQGGDPGSTDHRTAARWWREFRRIELRDHFGSDQHDLARTALEALSDRRQPRGVSP